MLEDMVGLCGLVPEILPVSKLCDFPVGMSVYDLSHCFLETNNTKVYPKGSNIYLVSDRKGSENTPCGIAATHAW